MCRKILEAVVGNDSVSGIERKVVTLSQDSFYKELTQSNRELANKGLYNFDHPGTNNIISI